MNFLGGMMVIILAFIGGICVGVARADFYRGYFRQKQRNRGLNPNDIMRNEIGIWWWIFF